MAGNKLGATINVKYVSDSGVEYQRRSDADLAAAVGAVAFNGPRMPQGLTPRVAYVKEDSGTARKALVIPGASDSLMTADTPTTISIDGVNFVTTGTAGEKKTF